MSNKPDSSDKMARPAPTRADRLRARRQPASAGAARVSPQREETPDEEPVERILLPTRRPQSEGNVFASPSNTKRQVFSNTGKKRNNLHGSPSVSKRYTIPLNKQGAELQVSSLPFTRFGWRGASGFLLIFSVIMLIIFTQMKVDTIQFIGVSEALAADIRNTLKVEGKAAYTLDPTALRQTMTIAFPEISDVRILIEFPGVMKVQAKARTPIYAWLLGERVYLIDDQYMVYPANVGESIEGLVVIHADQLPPPASVLQQSGDILAEIKQYVWPPDETAQNTSEGPVLQRSTYLVDHKVIDGLRNLMPFIPQDAVILYSMEHGFGWEAASGWDAWFGLDLSKMETKVGIYNAIVNKLAEENIKASLISVEFISAPYFREE